MRHSPGLTGPIPWDEAPTGTTHVFRGPLHDYWMQQTAEGWLFWSPTPQHWADDPHPIPKHYIARPATEYPYLACPDDATHTQNGTDRPYKAGPYQHARVWSTYNGEPAWVCASTVRNEDLDDPTKFAPIIRDPLQSPTNPEVPVQPNPTQPNPTQPDPTQQGPQTMNQTTVAFETKHYVYGMDVANMSSGQLIDAIKKLEAEIADLKGVKAKSEHIKKRIAELEGMLAKIVEVLDAK